MSGREPGRRSGPRLTPIDGLWLIAFIMLGSLALYPLILLLS